MLHQDSLVAGLDSLDLTMIKRKLMDPVEGEGWTAAYCDAVCQEYIRFLGLVRRYQQEGYTIVPSPEVDKVWHAHILDTRKYGPDCEQFLGFFLHHFPYLGMRGPGDEQVLYDSASATLDLYKEHFGEPSQGFWEGHRRLSEVPKCGAPLSEGETILPKCGAPAAQLPKCGAPVAQLPKCGAPLLPTMQVPQLPKCGAPHLPKCGAPLIKASGAFGLPKCGAPI